MASAAAVGANEAKSPLGNNIGEDDGYPGEITSGIYAKDEVPGVNGEINSDDDEELPTNPLRGRKADRAANRDDGDPLDLFGDDEDDDDDKPAARQLDDDELDEDDDVERTERVLREAEQEAEQEYVAQERITMDLEIPRQPIPEPSDGEMYVLKVPDFMSIEPHAWDHTTFQPPTTDHHSKQKPSATFSPYNTALTTIRWRHSPSNPSQLQSNARINRWEDGSLTLQLASDPTTQYEIDANALVPPQRNPVKPTPTSIHTGQRGGRHGTALDEKHSTHQDAFTYLFRPHEDSSTLIVTHKITAGLSIKQSDSVEDDAIERLQASLAAASNASKVNGASGFNLVQVDEDPEMAKAKAIAAVKQQEKAEKRRQAAMEREAARSNRVLGRAGLGSSRYSGLNVGMLEDDEMGEESRGRPSPHKGRAKPRRRRGSDYSDEDDRGIRDDYDRDDAFLAASDEEEEVADDDSEDPDDGIIDYDRERTPKRARESEPDDEDADAPGEEVDAVEENVVRTKRRRIIDEDEDEN